MRVNYRIDINLSKKIAYTMKLKYRHAVVPSKKKYGKKDRIKNRIRGYEEIV